MSGRFRRSYWNFNGRRRYARSRYSGRRNGMARRARGNMRAANQQNDISNVTINLMKKVKAGVTSFLKKVDGADKAIDIGVCALNIFELLKKSEFYKSYSNMYDQFRINRIQVKVTPVTWQTYNQFNLPNRSSIEVSGGNGGDNMEQDGEDEVITGGATGDPEYPTDGNDHYIGQAPTLNNETITTKYIIPQALTIVTAWDRTGLDDTQILEDGNNVFITIGDSITTYSSAKSTQLIAGANFNCIRYLYPSSQQEKSLYFSTTDLVDQFKAPVTNQKWYTSVKVDNGYDSNKITNLHADPNCPFKPTFLIGVLKVDDTIPSPIAEGQTQSDPENCKGQIYPVTFNLEFDIGVTFRGLRKTQVV